MRRALLLIVLAGCSSQLPASYIVRDLRVIALVAEPPEVAPGQPTSLTVYLADPGGGGRPVDVTFGRCPQRGDTDGTYDCDPSEELTLGHVGAAQVAPDLYSATIAYTPPADLFTGHSPLAQAYGFNEVILVHGRAGAAQIDGIKRLVVTAGDRPRNQNPQLKDLDVIGGGDLLGNTATPPSLKGKTAVQALPVYEAETLEPFSILRYDGTLASFKEEATFTWSCAPECTLDTDTTYDFSTVKVTPGKTDHLVLYVVMRDNRGGEAFEALRMPVTAR
jgi:hypothetical protein